MRCEVVEEEIEKEVKIFIELKSEEMYNKLYDLLWETDLETWTEDPWDEEQGVFVVQLRAKEPKVLLYFIIK
ncbi:hypothetical protein DRO69_00500 [Candidatus Bathyarchaeota archaeon]|nr:MAG: hypothetical protein DRO69_00500 [Candidatus Bathyarchaeota archaeon]